MSSIDNTTILIRHKIVTEVLQDKTKKEEFAKEDTPIEAVALLILQTFGQCYYTYVTNKFKCEDLRKLIEHKYVILHNVYHQLKTNQFDKFIRSLAADKSAFSTINLTEVGNEYLMQTLHLPWVVQKISAVTNLSQKWKGMNLIPHIDARRKEEEELDQKLMNAINTTTVNQKDVFPLEKYLLGPVAMLGEEVFSLFSLLRSWMLKYPKSARDTFISKSFPLTDVIKDAPFQAISMRENVTPPAASKPDQKSDDKTIVISAITPLASQVGVSFVDFRISFLIDCICKNLKISPFDDSTQFSSTFHGFVLKFMRESITNQKDAVFFAGRSTDIPETSAIKPFLAACCRFVQVREKARTTENVSFLLEWIALAEQENDPDFPTYEISNVPTKDTFSVMRQKIVHEWKVGIKYRFSILCSILNLPSLEPFETFYKSIHEKYFHIDDLFLFNFFKRKIPPQKLPELVTGCDYVLKTLTPYFVILRHKPLFWAEICEYIDTNTLVTLKEILGQFTKDVLPVQIKPASAAQANTKEAQAEENFVTVYQDCFLEVCLLYLKNLLYRSYIQEAIAFLPKLNRTFSDRERFLLFNYMRFISSLSNPAVLRNVNKRGPNGFSLIQYNTQQENGHKLLLAFDYSKLTNRALIDKYIEFISPPKK